MDELQPGDPRQVGQYQLLNRLGTGGMGRVYLGQAPGGQMVAVKLIRAELADDPDFRRRFAYEVAAAKRVSGIFTAPVVDADPDGPQPWLVTAYVSGPSLAAAVAEIGPLPVESVRTLAAGLAAGLSAVHAAGIVHRDLKPSNVLLASDGPRIIDFGISRAADTAWLTRAGGVMGSPGFMSPEQAEGHKVGPPTDIFSLGGVLAFAASGRSPFGAGSPSALLYRVVYGTAALGHVPAELRPLIERCLAKDPSARPTTRQLLAELGAAEPNKDWLSRHAPFLRGPASVAARATSVARGSHGASASGRAAGGTAAARAVAVSLTVVDRAPAAAPAPLADHARPTPLAEHAASAPLAEHAPPAPRSAPAPLAGLQADSRAAHQAPTSAALQGAAASAPQGAPPAAPQHPAVSTPPGGAPAASQSGGQPAPDYAAASAAALAAPAGAVAGTGFRDYDTAADRTMPARYWHYGRYAPRWRGAAGFASSVLALLLFAAGASWAVVAANGHPHHTAGRASSGSVPQPGPDQRKQVEAAPGPRAVVLAYFAAINERDWPTVWRLGGDRLSSSYHAMVAGYAETVRDDAQVVRVKGDTVVVQLRAYETGGVMQVFRVYYVVTDGTISSGSSLLVSSIAASVRPAQTGTHMTSQASVLSWRAGKVPVRGQQSLLPAASSDALKDLDISRPGGGNDVVGDLGTWGTAIPAADTSGPVPDELLIQISLRPAGLPLGGGPESG